jgi:hypothetical protein
MAARVCATDVLMKFGSGVATVDELQAMAASSKTMANARAGADLNIITPFINSNHNTIFKDAKRPKYVPFFPPWSVDNK